jgi:hypothetical protein
LGILTQGDRLYFPDVGSTGLIDVIESLPAAGGDASVIVQDVGAYLWAEGDNLLFASVGDRLQTVPLAGGTSALVQDGKACSPPSQCGGLALDDQYLYFNIDRGAGMTLRRMSRATGAEDNLATLSGTALLAQTRLVGDSLMVVGNQVYVVSRAGGDARQLADVSGVVGIDDQGVITVDVMPGQTSTTQRAPIDGGPLRAFWSNKPRHLQTLGIAPDAAGGWVAIGYEPFTDGSTHLSIWALDAQEKGTRIACDPRNSDPTDNDPDEDYSKVTASTPDAIYAAVSHLTTATWSLVRVAR